MDNEVLKELINELKDFRSECNEKIDSLNEKVSNFSINQALIRKDIEFMKEEDKQQNKLLDEHIEGIDQIHEYNTQNLKEFSEKMENERNELKEEIEKLKAPRKWIKGTMWLLTALGIISGAIYAIIRIIQFFKIII